ncbi:hypothetical protein [Xanthomonas hortorum]|uniref:Secreted protein n=2 Tax=Xanthomonas hortorum TaxID=56454 RepID=A0A6V7BR48_9XANT|nr:hypothetical protein [Xanthomonas hortorum]MCC4626941.1 hypothetical protein [Xanthomonas campestris pv. nigromaculans]MCC8497098.1 hypothetical protein [Xanthomonas hortorum pv. gardneri]MCC8506351.1 hypothetical protein [Xanthomonas hortorum pv. gardneri]MCC8512960.1 hypothetical protein [Xanthomonas hortorum pv. gardneri]MCC8655095.1 hypothetical protein [Xanthomonas hortorum pv. gardneri]
MKKAKIVLAIVAALASASVCAQTRVSGYHRADGTYVQPHYRSAANSTTLDNYSTRGNVNPYTGRVGTVDPYREQNTYRQPAPQATYGLPRSDSVNPYGSGY